MNDTLDVILVNRCNQNDEFRTILPAKMGMRVLVILLLAAAAVLVLACAGVVAGGATWVVDDDGGADYASMQAMGAAA